MQPATIMIVDDEAHIRSILKLSLEGAGYHVVEFGSAGPALEALAQVKPDLIISDHEMPGAHNGLEMVRQLRTGATECAATPFILLTGSTLLHLQLKNELAAIANLELQSKPFSIRTLVRQVNGMLEAAAGRTAA